MRILIAPDKFKGSLGASEVSECIAAGWREVLPKTVIDLVPMADGGEGTAEVIGQARDGRWVTCDAHDALGRPVQARYIWLQRSATAVMEMSEAAGLSKISENDRDPLRANTAGVGEMLLDAVSRGAKSIILGLGGSATNDGGFGMARVLGYQFLDVGGVELKDGPAELIKLEKVQRGRFTEQLVAAADVRNPLLGDDGATKTFGRQKGATVEQLELLEKAVKRLADIVTRDLGFDYRAVPGAGAAGGLGFGLMSFCGAKVRAGFDVVAEAVDLEGKMRKVDLVITGEGHLDQQTLSGKAPAGVAKLARSMNKPVFAIVGQADQDRSLRETFDGVLELNGQINQARKLLRERAQELAMTFKEKASYE